MRLLRAREPYEPGQVFTLIPLGDLHLGSANVDWGHLKRVLRRIEVEPNIRWIGMGDLLESIAPDDKRWNPADVDKKVVTLRESAEIRRAYVAKLAEILAPIMSKCWGMNDGNHEDKFNVRYYTNLLLDTLDLLGYPHDLYGGWSSFTNVVFEEGTHRCNLRVYQQHGWQAGRKKGAKVNNLDDLMGYIEGCHIHLVAHSHERILTTKTKLGATASFHDFKSYDSYGAHTGSFLRTYQKDKVGYAEKHSFPPVSLGPVEFEIAPGRGGVEIKGIL
jgi:hypothetical protein